MFRRFLLWLIHSRFFIAMCAVSMVYTTQLMSGLPVTTDATVILVFFGTYFYYNLHAYSIHARHLRRTAILKFLYHSLSRRYDIIFSFLVVAMTAFYIPPPGILFLAVLSLLSLWYSFPVAGDSDFTLKKGLYIKTPLIAFGWSVITVLLPLLGTGIDDTYIAIMFIARFLFIFALCLPFEIRDTRIDRLAGVSTIPVVYGLHRTIITGAVICIASILFHHWMRTFGLPFITVFALDITTVLAFIWIFRIKDYYSPFYHYLFVDGTMIVRFIFVIIATGYHEKL